jgi:hypothetical protein
MDFRLCDVRTDPPATSQPFHTERLVALPESPWCYQAIERNGHVTFGSFNAAAKVTPAACRRWGQILLRVPQSRLLIVDTKSARKREAILADIASTGVAADRIEFLSRIPLGEYMGSSTASTSRSTPSRTAAAPRPSIRCGWACPRWRPSATSRCRAARRACSAVSAFPNGSRRPSPTTSTRP